MKKNIILDTLVDITNNSLGYIPSTPTEFNELSREIQKKTGRSLSLSSIKRIWGYVRYEGFPSVTTLTTLAQYNDFKDWESFVVTCSGNSSFNSGFMDDDVIDPGSLNVGDRILLGWGRDKMCEMECISPARFQVNESRNIKLAVGDTFTLHTLCKGHPLYISDIDRSGIRVPAYIGAKKGGIITITVTHKSK